MNYTPDRWVIVEIEHKGEKLHKVLGSWYGGFAGSDSWRLNSGITKATYQYGAWAVEGNSGSIYICPDNCYGMSVYIASVVAEAPVKVLTEGEAIAYLRTVVPDL